MRMISHIVHIVADGAAGGGTTAVLGLCSDAISAGFKVTVITQPNSYASDQLELAGVKVFGFDFFTSRFDLGIARRLHAVIADIEPGIVHVHGARAANPFWQGILRKTKYPIFYTVHGFHFHKKRFPVKLLQIFAERRIAARVDHTIFVSHSDASAALKSGILSKSSSVVYNGVDPLEISAFVSASKDFDVIFAARLHEQKNPLFYLKVVAALRGRGLRFAMVGGGELAGAVRAEADRLGLMRSVVFTGALSRDDTLRIVGRSRVYILPSKWEGLPIGPIEAMFCGVPTVASAIDGTSEVVSNGETGFLIQSFDEVAYADAIVSILENAEIEGAMSLCSKARAESLFNRYNNNRSILDLYSAVTCP